MKWQQTRRNAYQRRSVRPWLPVLIAVMVAGLGRRDAAFALPFDPVGPQPIEKFTPPPNGFVWQMPSRFGTIKDNGTIDFHWTPDTYSGTFVGGPGFERLTVSNGYYDPGYVQPDHLEVDFDGCPSQSEENLSGSNATQNTYTWNMVSGVGALPLLRNLAATFLTILRTRNLGQHCTTGSTSPSH